MRCDIFLACVKLGVIFVPINILYREREIAHIKGGRRAAGDVITAENVEALTVDESRRPPVGRWRGRQAMNRLIAIASRMLGCELCEQKGHFFNFRYAGASHIREQARDARALMLVVNMIGDTNVETP